MLFMLKCFMLLPLFTAAALVWSSDRRSSCTSVGARFSVLSGNTSLRTKLRPCRYWTSLRIERGWRRRQELLVLCVGRGAKWLGWLAAFQYSYSLLGIYPPFPFLIRCQPRLSPLHRFALKRTEQNPCFVWLARGVRRTLNLQGSLSTLRPLYNGGGELVIVCLLRLPNQLTRILIAPGTAL
jgi:hypothetical protein